MCNSSVRDIPVIGQYLSKPARLLPMATSALGTTMGIGPTMTNLLGTGVGALQGGTTGLWGDKGILPGAAQGFAQSLLGRGIGGGINNWRNPAPNTTFNQGFMSQLGQAIPYGQKIGEAFGMNINPYQTTNQFMSNYYGNPPAGSAVANLKNSMSPAEWTSTLSAGSGKYVPTESLVSDYYANPPVGSAMAKLKSSMSPTDWDSYLATNTKYTPTGADKLLSTAADTATSTAAKTAGGLAQEAGDNKNLLQKLLPSAALTLIGGAIPQPEYDVPDAASVYKNLVANGNIPTYAGELGKAAQTATLNNINSPDAILADYMNPYKEAIISDLNRREAEEIAWVRTQHSQNGTGGGSDEMRDVQTVQAKYRDARNQQLGAIEENLYNQKVSIYLKSISDAYGMDQANLETIAGLTGTTIQEAALKYSMKAEQVKQFRDAIYQLAVSAAPGANETTAASLLGKLIKA